MHKRVVSRSTVKYNRHQLERLIFYLCKLDLNAPSLKYNLTVENRSQLCISTDETTIYSFLDNKFSQFDEIKLMDDLKNNLQSVFNGDKNWFVNFNASKNKTVLY